MQVCEPVPFHVAVWAIQSEVLHVNHDPPFGVIRTSLWCGCHLVQPLFHAANVLGVWLMRADGRPSQLGLLGWLVVTAMVSLPSQGLLHVLLFIPVPGPLAELVACPPAGRAQLLLARPRRHP